MLRVEFWAGELPVPVVKEEMKKQTKLIVVIANDEDNIQTEDMKTPSGV